MTLSQMRDLARVILRETRKFTSLVGGPDQIGVFPAKGQPSFIGLTNLPTDRRLARRFFLNRLLYTPGSRGANGPCVNGSFQEDFKHSLDEVIPQTFSCLRI